MKQCGTGSDQAAARRYRPILLVATLIFAGVALALLASGCGSNSGGGAPSAQPSPSSSGTPVAQPSTSGNATSNEQSSSSPATTWSAQTEPDAALVSVAFANDNDGWAVGGYEGGASVILATTNGGATWKVQYARNPGVNLLAVAFPNASDGWAVGSDGEGDFVILATTNGGSTWRVQDSGTTGPNLRAVTFANADDGWAVGSYGISSSVILATTDGGATWNEQGSAALGSLTAVAFADASDGCAVGDAVVTTSDGGITWNSQNVDDQLPGVMGNYTTTGLSGVAFANASDGWAVGGGAIFNSTDGGTTWNLQYSGTHDLNAIDFANASDGWAVGTDGFILATTDGGDTWNAQTSGTTTAYLSAVAFPDAGHGWAVGNDTSLSGNPGVILAATNGTAVSSAAGDSAPAPQSSTNPTSFAGSIVQWTGDTKSQKTAWYVTSDLRRLWIPDIPTFWALKAAGARGPVALPANLLNELPDQTGLWAAAGDNMTANRSLRRGMYLRSPDLRDKLILQNNGNLVLRDSSGTL